jgi:hypothetical protein
MVVDTVAPIQKLESGSIKMNMKRLATQLAGIACVATLAGCATNDQGNLVVDPNKVNAIIAGALTPPPPPPPVIVEEAYVPGPNDVYIAAVEERDVVIVGGDTFIWYVGPDGHRHRRFYAHGDHRHDVFARRDELHRVMANHEGHLPDHAIAGHGPEGHPGGPQANHAALAAGKAPAPAPAAKPAASSKEVKKS